MMVIQSDTLESICDEIFNFDPKIRFVGIINDNGRLENKKGRVEVFGDLKNQEIFLMEIALGVRMRREHDRHLGSVKFTISCGDRINSMIFPLSEKILYISTEKETDVLKLSFLILQLLEKI